MGRELTGTYEEWVAHIFDHPVGEREWHWEDDAPYWKADDPTTAEFLGRMFKESGKLPDRYSDKQISIGLNYLLDAGKSEDFFALLDNKVAWDVRRDGLQAIRNVFSDLFAKRCTEHLCHLDEPGAGELNGICYMWWDIAPVYGKPVEPACAERDALLLQVMADTLKLNSEACRESALHGLGHWHDEYPEEVKGVIHDFIWKNRKIRDPLRNYAYAAMNGDVL